MLTQRMRDNGGFFNWGNKGSDNTQPVRKPWNNDPNDDPDGKSMTARTTYNCPAGKLLPNGQRVKGAMKIGIDKRDFPQDLRYNALWSWLQGIWKDYMTYAQWSPLMQNAPGRTHSGEVLPGEPRRPNGWRGQNSGPAPRNSNWMQYPYRRIFRIDQNGNRIENIPWPDN